MSRHRHPLPDRPPPHRRAWQPPPALITALLPPWPLPQQNGNGLCSLAEIEGFIMGTLCAKYPKDGKTSDKGRDLFELFRPCYIQAYNDAKDIMADNGEVRCQHA